MPRASILCFAVISCLLLATAHGQFISDQLEPPTHAYSLPTVGIIDGATNPELVRDSVAYRLYFIAVSENSDPSPDQAARPREGRRSCHDAKEL
jgi:hypothetical protein